MQLLTFKLGGVKFGIPIQDVQSIEQNVQTVGIPNALPYIKGIMNLHGNIIPVYSLSAKFGYPEQTIENVVVTDVRGMLIGFEVCKVEEILEVAGEHIAPMPQLINCSQHYMTDVADYNKNLIVMLDVGELVTEEEAKDLKEMLEKENA